MPTDFDFMLLILVFKLISEEVLFNLYGKPLWFLLLYYHASKVRSSMLP